MKQTIEIEVPDGKKAVWNDGKIEFVDVDIKEVLKNSEYPEQDLLSIITKEINNGNIDEDDALFDLYKEYMDSQYDSYIESVIKLKLFLAYLNKDNKPDLISGDVYYPYVRFYLKSKLLKNETVISQFKYKGEIYVLVKGSAYRGSYVGVCFYNYYEGVGSSSSGCGFLACKDKETAQFIATTFGKLLFDVNYKGLIDYEWLD